MNPWFQLEMAREKERDARRLASAPRRRAARPPRRAPGARLVRAAGLFMIRVGARLAGPGEAAPVFAPRLSRSS